MQHETFNTENILTSESQGGISSPMSKARGLHAARSVHVTDDFSRGYFVLNERHKLFLGCVSEHYPNATVEKIGNSVVEKGWPLTMTGVRVIISHMEEEGLVWTMIKHPTAKACGICR
jgi:hypothetical protein